jgi:hypothetical protein
MPKEVGCMAVSDTAFVKLDPQFCQHSRRLELEPHGKSDPHPLAHLNFSIHLVAEGEPDETKSQRLQPVSMSGIGKRPYDRNLQTDTLAIPDNAVGILFCLHEAGSSSRFDQSVQSIHSSDRPTVTRTTMRFAKHSYFTLRYVQPLAKLGAPRKKEETSAVISRPCPASRPIVGADDFEALAPVAFAVKIRNL